jgi:N-acetylornithine carbamoyltransferase
MEFNDNLFRDTSSDGYTDDVFQPSYEGCLDGLGPLKGKSFLSTGDLAPNELRLFIESAIKAKALGPSAFQKPLIGKSIALVFFNPSLRTRVSMTVAITQLGGTAIPLEIGSGTWDLEHVTGVVMDGTKVEHVREAVPVLSQYVDAIAVRCFPGLKDYAQDAFDPVLRAFNAHASVPVINLESAAWHPCQALADMMTIREKCGGFKRRKVVLTWAHHPKPLPHAVPQSFALASAQCGVDLWITAPHGYMLDPTFIQQATEVAESQGGTVTVTADRHQAFEGADVVYAKSWASRQYYGKPEDDLRLRRDLKHWMVTDEMMAKTRQGLFMHCLPVRRNVVVSDSVLDGPHSVVVHQAANRLHAQRALLAGIFA